MKNLLFLINLLICATASANYAYESYLDTWSSQWCGKPTPHLPEGVVGDLSFGIIDHDASFHWSYPLTPLYGCTGLAIGGWNNSQPEGGTETWENNGLFTVMTSSDPALRQRLIHNIVTAVKIYGYRSVEMDYENYQYPPPNPALYTQFMIDLEQALPEGVHLNITISPSPYDQQYFDITTLVKETNINFHIMCYDYAMGQMMVRPNAGVEETWSYLLGLKMRGVPMERIAVGFPTYGVAFYIDPSLTPAQVKEHLKNKTLPATSLWTGDNNDGNGQVGNDYILANWIGNWENPQNGWQILHDNSTPPETFYYNAEQHLIVSANSSETMHNFAQMIKEYFPEVIGFFNWSGNQDPNGVMMKQLMHEMEN